MASEIFMTNDIREALIPIKASWSQPLNCRAMLGLGLLCSLSFLCGCAGLSGQSGLSGFKQPGTLASSPSVDGISQARSYGSGDGKPEMLPSEERRPVEERLAAAEVIPVQYVTAQDCPPVHSYSAACPPVNDSCPIQHGRRVRDLQEYIFDGGDLDPDVVVKRDWSAAGVNETDTVIYYETPGGKVCVHPTNRVAIYAPRFGVVRQVTGAVFAENAQSLGRVYTPVSPYGLEDQNGISGVSLSTGPIAQKQLLQLDRFHDEQNPIPVASVIPPTPLSDAVSALINVDVLAVDQANIREVTAVEDRTAMIQTLWLPESISVYVSGESAVAVSSAKQVAEVVVYDTPDGCSIRIRKQVSHREAQSGDIVRFSIFFENIGPSRAGNVVIIDSLSPRLEYIEGSQLSSVKTRFAETPNSLGSSELRWELESVVEVNDSGVISFDCRVR